jgi:NADPH2:quinone reductase
MNPGQRVVVQAFGETPPEAIEQQLSLQPQEAPDVTRLSPREVVIGVKSASVGWVDLLMTSGQYQHQAKPPY